MESEDVIKGMAHFVTTPGVVNADKVIVQLREYAAGLYPSHGAAVPGERDVGDDTKD